MRIVKVRINATQFDGSMPKSMGFELGKTYNLIPVLSPSGELFYRKSRGAGIWLARRFRVIKGK